MISALIIIIVFLVLLISFNITKIIEYFHYRKLMGLLPTVNGKKFFVGHAYKSFGVPYGKNVFGHQWNNS